MNVLANSLLLFGFAFVVHLVLWRIRVPRRQIATLLVLFAGFLVLGSCLFFGSSAWLGLPWVQWARGLPPLASLADFIQVGVFYIAFSLAYMTVYTGLAADSPSLVLILEVAAAGADGLSRESLLERASDRILVEPRLRDLVTDRVVEFDGQHYRLLPKGTRLARLFTLYRTVLMGRPEKGG